MEYSYVSHVDYVELDPSKVTAVQSVFDTEEQAHIFNLHLICVCFWKSF